MALNTAERVSREVSDNFVYQRSRLAYYEAAKRVEGRVLEIGTGTGYGIEIIAPHAERYVTLDKHCAVDVASLPVNVEFREAKVPPLPFADEEFGPLFEPLAEAIVREGVAPRIICESDGTQAEDALYMKNAYFKQLEA